MKGKNNENEEKEMIVVLLVCGHFVRLKKYLGSMKGERNRKTQDGRQKEEKISKKIKENEKRKE